MIEKEFVNDVLRAFYQEALFDIFLSYHFRKIPNFPKHLEATQFFWYRVLNLDSTDKNAGKNLIDRHRPLNIKKGELGRWMILFEKNLQEVQKHYQKNGHKIDTFANLWWGKVLEFEKLFQKSFRFT